MTSENRHFSILFVCLGNICRSPTAEAVFRTLAAREAAELALSIDSAGTADYHVGCEPDRRARETARRRGYDMSGMRARRVEAEDFERFDLILAMDRSNWSELRQIAPPAARERIRLFLEYGPDVDLMDVPDPYYGGPNGFEAVLDMIEATARGLLQHLQERARADQPPSSRPPGSRGGSFEGAEDQTT
jgi:protein-tyrosine phosphatase